MDRELALQANTPHIHFINSSKQLNRYHNILVKILLKLKFTTYLIDIVYLPRRAESKKEIARIKHDAGDVHHPAWESD